MCVVHRCSVQRFSAVSEVGVSPDVVKRLVLVPVPPVGPLLVQQLTLCSHVHLVNGGVRTLEAGPEKVEQHDPVPDGCTLPQCLRRGEERLQ